MALCTSLSPTWLSRLSRNASEKGEPWGRQDRSRVGTLPMGGGTPCQCHPPPAPLPPAPRRPQTHCEASRGRKAGGSCRARGPARPTAAAHEPMGTRGAAPAGRGGGRRAGDPPMYPPGPPRCYLRGRSDVLGAQEQAGEVAGQPQALEVPDEVPVDDGVTVHQLRLRQKLPPFVLHQTLQLLPQHQGAQVGESHSLRPPRRLRESGESCWDTPRGRLCCVPAVRGTVPVCPGRRCRAPAWPRPGPGSGGGR